MKSSLFLVLLAFPLPYAGMAAGSSSSPLVSIYPLANGGPHLDVAMKRPLGELGLDARPWIGPEDIEFYDISAHAIYLKAGAKPADRPADLRGTPFVLTAKNERIFLGAFWTHISSFSPPFGTPLIYTFDPGLPIGVLRFELPRLDRGDSSSTPTSDPREDPRLLKAFREAGRLHQGIELALSQVSVSARSEKSSTVRYTFILKNRDTDTLLVLDPDKTGSRKFHWFCNGVYLRPHGGALRGFGPNLDGYTQRPDPATDIKSQWVTPLAPGTSLKRTVELPTYPSIPGGSYEAVFTYHSPGMKSLSETRLPSGRVWLGQVTARTTVEIR